MALDLVVNILDIAENYSEIRKFKGAVNPMYRIILNFANIPMLKDAFHRAVLLNDVNLFINNWIIFLKKN